MPVKAADTEITYTGDGASTAFPFPFEVAVAGDFAATLDGVTTTAYSLSGLGVDTGGTCTFTTAPAVGVAVVLYRAAAYDRQLVDYQAGGEFAADTVDSDFDRVVMLSQQLATALKRIPQVKRGDLTKSLTLTPEASKLLGWDGTASGIVNVSASTISPSTVVTTTIGQQIMTAADAAAERVILGVPLMQNSRRGGVANGSGGNLSITAVQCVGANNLTGAADFIFGTSNMTKTPAAWAVGSGNGACIDGGACAINTWYRVLAVKRTDTGVVDYAVRAATTSASIPGFGIPFGTMPAAYTVYAQLGWARTDGAGNFVTFVTQRTVGGLRYFWSTSVLDVNTTNPGVAAVSAGVTVPPKSVAIVDVSLVCATGASYGRLFGASQPDEAPGSTNSNISAAATGRAAGRFEIDTGDGPGNGTIRYRFSASDAGLTIAIRTLGWVDTDGPFI